MQYRRFGRTELNMPVFSTGGMRYQYKWQDAPFEEISADSHANLERTIARSIELGINHIETARGYGSSERQLGFILPKYPREELIVQTKVGPCADPAEFRANFLDSLERLQLSHVDLLGVHGINNPETLEWSVKPGGCLDVARELQREGLVRHVGFSTHATFDILMEAVATERSGGFDYVNLHWYYIFQKNWPAILEATRRDMGVFIISPTDKGGKLYEPPARLSELTSPLHPIVFNDVFCLSHPQVHTLSVGASKPEDYDRHIEALPLMERHAEHLAPILAQLEKAIEEAVGMEFWRTFDAEVPRIVDTPNELSIATITWLTNLADAFDLHEYARMRYNLLGRGGHWFPGTNAENFDEAVIRNVLKDSPWTDRLLKILSKAHDRFGGEEVKRLSSA